MSGWLISLAMVLCGAILGVVSIWLEWSLRKSMVVMLVIIQGATLGVIAAKRWLSPAAIISLIFVIVLLGVFVIMTLAGGQFP